MKELHVKHGISSEDFVAHLTDAAYQVALKRGFKGSFLDFELELYEKIQDVIRKEMEEDEITTEKLATP